VDAQITLFPSVQVSRNDATACPYQKRVFALELFEAVETG